VECGPQGEPVRICDFSTHLGSVDLLAVSLHASEAVWVRYYRGRTRPRWGVKNSYLLFGTPTSPSATLRLRDAGQPRSRPPDRDDRVGSGSPFVGEPSGLEPSAAQSGTGHVMELA